MNRPQPAIAMSMESNASISFFNEQFKVQALAGECELNPFELAALPYVFGEVLDYGCGMGNLAINAARRGCAVVALDGSEAAVAHIAEVARRESLTIDVREVDLRAHMVTDQYDCVLCIGLLMFFDCPTAYRQLASLQSHVRPGGIAVVNVLTEGTTYLDMFSAKEYCLFKPDALQNRFVGWEILHHEHQSFQAPGNTTKAFTTTIARRPQAVDT